MPILDYYFTDFQLGNKQLKRDFNAYTYVDDINIFNISPSKTINTEKVPGLDGEIPYSVTYDPRIIPLKIYIDNPNFDMISFTNWINSKEERWFNFIGDERKIKVMIDKQLDMSLYNDSQATIDLEFIAYNPYYYYINDTIFRHLRPVINEVYRFNNKGNKESFPVITLKCEGQKTNVEFEINGERVKIKNINSDIIIDCQNECVYNYVGERKVYRMGDYEYLNGYKYSFPKLTTSENTFKLLTSALTEVEIKGNSRSI